MHYLDMSVEVPPKPGAFLGMNDIVIAEEVRKRVMMEASQIQTDMNNFNGKP